MKKIFFSGLAVISLILFFATSAVVAQSDSQATLLVVGRDTVTKGEFLSSFQKNNQLDETTPDELREYLNLFINFKLKVTEGKEMMIDTSEAFRAELGSYINQSAQQYLTATEVTDELFNEAVENSKWHLRASHILIDCSPYASPKDTLAAYNKALSIREQIVNGLDFFEAAVKYSDDVSARDVKNPKTGKIQLGNRGELGYFTAFDLIYPFEHVAFQTPVGDVSMPVRSKFGYHLILVQDKVPAFIKMQVAQIFLADTGAKFGTMNEQVRKKIDVIYDAFNNGATFEELVQQYSDDAASKESGGVMQPFAPNRRSANFVEAGLKLKEGEISQPVSSFLGWHIIKLIKVYYYDKTDESVDKIRNKIANDSRSQKSKDVFIDRLKKEYRFTEAGKKAAFKFFQKYIPVDYFQSTKESLDLLPGIEKLKPLFTFADREVPVSDFAAFLSRFQGINLKTDVPSFIEERYQYYVNDYLMKYEQEHLTSKYPEFKDLITEYNEGMILYEINSLKVWTKALKDTIGLKNYYDKIKENYKDTLNGGYKPMSEIRAIVISEYQNYLEQQWLSELRSRYPVYINENIYNTILKK